MRTDKEIKDKIVRDKMKFYLCIAFICDLLILIIELLTSCNILVILLILQNIAWIFSVERIIN